MGESDGGSAACFKDVHSELTTMMSRLQNNLNLAMSAFVSVMRISYEAAL